MSFFLSQSFTDVSRDELRRIQRRMGLILRRGEEPRTLFNSISRAFESLGGVQSILGKAEQRLSSDRQPATSAFLEILRQFGSAPASSFDDEELIGLRNLPLVVEQKNGDLVVPAEAYAYLARDRWVQKQNFLFTYLYQLSMMDWKSYWAWVDQANSLEGPGLQGSTGTGKNYRIRFLELYEKIFQLRVQSPREHSSFPSLHGAYLDEICEPDPTQSPVGWFLSDILPFYRAISDVYRKDPPPEKRLLLEAFRRGNYVIAAEEVAFDQPVRWRVIETAEYALPYSADSEKHDPQDPDPRGTGGPRASGDPQNPANPETSQFPLF